MDGETNLEAIEAPEVEDVSVENGQETEIQLDDEGNPVEQEPEAPEMVEVERDGQKYTIPAALKDDFLRQADYTKKTQEVAESRKAIETRLAEIDKATTDELNARAQVTYLERQKAELEATPIAGLSDEQIHYLRQQLSFVKQDITDAKEGLKTLTEQRATQMQQETARRMEEADAVLQRDIPGWGAERANALIDFAKKQFGFSQAEIDGIHDPKIVKVLNSAFEASKVQSKQQVAQKVQAQTAIKPAATVKGGQQAIRGVDDRLSTDNWMKARMAQLSK